MSAILTFPRHVLANRATDKGRLWRFQGRVIVSSALGVLLRKLREKRGLTLRELGQLAGLNHAYIHRLETGAKEAPSAETMQKLSRALKPTPREAALLRYIVENPALVAALVEHAMDDQSVTVEEVAIAAGVVYRGPVRQDYKTVIERVRRMLGQGDG